MSLTSSSSWTLNVSAFSLLFLFAKSLYFLFCRKKKMLIFVRLALPMLFFFKESLFNKDTRLSRFSILNTKFVAICIFFFLFLMFSLSSLLGRNFARSKLAFTYFFIFCCKIVVEECGKTFDICQFLSQLQNNDWAFLDAS